MVGEIDGHSVRDIGKQGGNVFGERFGGGKRVVGADRDARDGAIGEDEDESGIDDINILLDMGSTTLLVQLVPAEDRERQPTQACQGCGSSEEVKNIHHTYKRWYVPICRSDS